MSQRSASDVFEQHLQFRVAGQLDQDLQLNYAEDATLICEFGALHGREAIRRSAERLGLQLPGARFEFPARYVDGNYAFLVWNARASESTVHYGVDTFVIHQGRIVMQSIYYRVDEQSEG